MSLIREHRFLIPYTTNELRGRLPLAASSFLAAWIDRLASEATSARKLIDHLDEAILAKAFRGELVPQDPSEEPASVLLERIRAERDAALVKAKAAKGAPRNRPAR